MTVRQFQHRTRYTTHMSSHGGQQPARARMVGGGLFGAAAGLEWADFWASGGVATGSVYATWSPVML